MYECIQELDWIQWTTWLQHFSGVAHELLDERPLSCAYKNFNLHSRHSKKKKKEKKSNPRDINKTNSMLRNITLWSRDRIHLPETKLCFFLFLFTRQSWALKIDQAKNFFEQSYFYLKKKQTKKTLECNVYFRILSTLNASQISRAILWRANEIHPWLSKPLLRPSCPSLFTREKRENPQKRNGRSRINTRASTRRDRYIYIHIYIYT